MGHNLALADDLEGVTCQRCHRVTAGKTPAGFAPKGWRSGDTRQVRVPVLLADKLLEIARLADQCEEVDPMEFLEEVRWRMEWKPEEFSAVKPVTLADLRQQRRGPDNADQA
jgi:hypothetical protein